MNEDKELEKRYRQSIASSKIRKLIPSKIKNLTESKYSYLLSNDKIEDVITFNSFLKENTQHISFLKSFNSSFDEIVFDLMGYVFIHTKQSRTSYCAVIHSMVLLEAIELIGKEEDFTDTELGTIKQITDDRIIEIFHKVMKYNTQEACDFFQTILEDSYDYIKESIDKKLDTVRNELPEILHKMENIYDYMDTHRYKMQDVFTNSNILRNINSNNHALSFIKNIPIEIVEEKIIYKKFAEALINGFVDMYLLNSFGNRESRNLIQKYINDNNYVNKDSIFSFQKFIEQNKSFAKTIPFKYLQKSLDLSEKQIKSYSRFILGFDSENLSEKLNNLIVYSNN